MKKFIGILLVVALVALVIAPVAAAPTNRLNSLAKHFPADTAMFISFRTDDAYIDALDALIAQVAAAVPDAGPVTSIRDGLNEGISQLLGDGTFDSEVRTWLGDVASVGVTSLEQAFDGDSSNDDENPFLVAVAINDRAGAEDFFERGLSNSGTEFTSDEQDGFTVLTSSDDEGIIAVGDSVLYISNDADSIPFSDPSSPLSQDENFTNVTEALPAGDYNITAYINVGSIFSALREMENFGSSEMAILGSVAPFIENYPGVAIGATILDERSLTIDFVQPYTPILEAMAEMGVEMSMPGPVDPAFANRIPAGTPVVIHGTGLNLLYENFLAQLQLQAEMMSGMDMPGAMTEEQIAEGLQQVSFVVQGLTGLNFEEEIIPALDGDFALYLSLKPDLAEAESMMDVMGSLPVDFGLLVEVNDPTVTQGLIKGIGEALKDAQDVTVEESMEDNFPRLDISITSRDVPFPIQLVLTGNDDVLFFGTPDVLNAALREDGGLPSDAAFQEAGVYALSDANQVWYLAPQGFLPLVNLATVLGSGPSAETQAQQLEALLNLFSSSSLTTSLQGDYQYSRAVLTLSQ